MILVNALRYLFLLMVLAPGLAGLCVWFFREVPSGWPRFVAILGQVDSGFQLGVNSFLLRLGLLAVAGLAVLLGLPIPREGRWMWRCGWAFLVVAALSALSSSHPYEAVLTVLDTALLYVVVLVTFHFRPRFLLPLAYTVGAAAVAVASLFCFFTGELDLNDDGRLNGTFFQPNVTAAFLAAALPWLLNQFVGVRGRERVQLGSLFVAVPIYVAFILTGTRAAMLVTLLVLFWRWWLGGSLRRGSSLLAAVLQASAASAVMLAMCWLAVFKTIGLVLVLVLVAWAAGRSGIPWWTLALLACLCVGTYALQQKITQLKNNPYAGITKRTVDLQKGSDASLSSRKEFWRAALLMGLDHPWSGVGPRGFHRYYPGYQSDVRWFSKFCHSACLSCFAELGFPGAILMCILALQWLLAIGGRLQSESPEFSPGDRDRDRLLDAASSALILALCMAVDVQWLFPALPVAWALWLGLTLSYSWPEVPASPPPPPDPDLSPWTLRPQVVTTYFLLAVLGISAALDMTFAMAQAASERSDLLLKTGNVAGALKCDEDSVVLNPFQGAYFQHYGLTYGAGLAKKLDKLNAQEYLRLASRAVALDSHRAVNWDLLHKALVVNGKPDEARAALQKALECDPVNYPSFYVGLADLLSKPEDKSQREQILLSCADRFPTDALEVMFSFRSDDIIRQLAEVYMLLADQTDRSHPELALSYYDKFLKLQPDEPNARMGRIVCLVNLGRLREARIEAVALYRRVRQPQAADVVKHIYGMERMSYDPNDFVLSTQPK
ncbi:O-antigen ligase family protein [bacterium]|nr:O-antigen ligase family protein [bacterium]